jgi:hypothetical protein
LVRSLHQRLVALLIGFALAMLTWPGELQARDGRSAVETPNNRQLAMQTPRRATLGLPRPYLDLDDGAKVAHALHGELPLLGIAVDASDRVEMRHDGGSSGDRELRVRRLRTRGPPAL